MEEELEIILKAVDDASSTFESVTESANEMGSSFTETATEGTEGFEDLQDSAQSTGETLQQAFEEATAEVERLQDALDQAHFDGDDIEADRLADELYYAEAEAERLSEALEELNSSGPRDAAGGMDELENEANEADQAVRDLSDDLTIINSSMLLQTAEQLGAIGDKAEGMAQDMNEAAISVGQLATQTGIAEPEMVNLINTISNATFPNDEAMMYVKALNQMGVEASNFGKSATDMDKINDAFGLGAQTVTGLSNELSVLGVDMNNVSDSFNALAYANANTVGGMENFYSFVKKFDADFNQLGFDVDQTAVIIAQATHKFGAGRAAYKGLSDALKEADGDTRKLEEALGLEAGALDNASQLTGEYEGQLEELASEEAEHKTWLDQLGAAWEDFSLSMSPVLEPLGAAIGLIGEVGSFGLQVKGLTELSGLIRGSITWIKEFNLVKAVQNALEGEGAIASIAAALGITTEAAAAEGATVAFGGLAIAEGAALWPILAIIAAIALLVVAVYEIGKAFGWWSDVGSMIDAIWAGIQRLWAAFINHPDVQAVIGAISEAWNMLSSAIMGVLGAIAEFLGISTDGDFDVVAAIIQTIGAAWDFVKQPLIMIISILSTILGTLWDVVNGNLNATTSITNIWNALVANMPVILTALFNVYKTIWTAIFNFVISLVRSIVSRVVSFMSSLVGKVYSALMGVVASIRSAIQAWITAAVAKVTQLVNNVVNWFSQLPNKISSALSGVVSAITSPFKQAYDDVCGIVDNISSKVQEGLNYLGSLGGAAGGELAAGGETFAAGGESYTFNNQKIEVETTNTVILDLQNVPAHIDTDSLIDMLSNPDVLKALTGNKDFQDLDSKVKLEIQRRANRARGV